MSAGGEAAELAERAVDTLRQALSNCLDVADQTGHNLPEMLREALEEVAISRRSVHTLVRHRPGSWEAQLVMQLAEGAQAHFDEALRDEAAELGHRITYDRNPAPPDGDGAVRVRCSCGWGPTGLVADGRPIDDMAHVREVVEMALRARAAELGHTAQWSPGEPVACSCGWPQGLEVHGARILDHLRTAVAAPASTAAQLAARTAAVAAFERPVDAWAAARAVQDPEPDPRIAHEVTAERFRAAYGGSVVEREAGPYELCSCGRPARTVWEAEVSGRAPGVKGNALGWCGVLDVPPVSPCPFCGTHAPHAITCPDYRLVPPASIAAGVEASDVVRYGGSTERPAEPGELCTCGRPAVIVFCRVDDGHETGYCGVSNVTPVSPCPFCGADEPHEGKCPDYQTTPTGPPSGGAS